jgi:hypothetical protein
MVQMNEHSATTIPGANKHVMHVEQGVDRMTFAEEARSAYLEAEKRSTKKVNKQ